MNNEYFLLFYQLPVDSTPPWELMGPACLYEYIIIIDIVVRAKSICLNFSIFLIFVLFLKFLINLIDIDLIKGQIAANSMLIMKAFKAFWMD